MCGDFDERPKLDLPSAPAPALPFPQTDTYKRLIQDVAVGEKSIGQGLTEAYDAGVTAAKPKERTSA